MPIPEPEYRKGADGYLITLAPLHGRVRALRRTLGRYRVHGANGFWAPTADRRIRGALARYDCRAATLAAHASRAGGEPRPDEWRRRNPYVRWLERLDRALTAIERAVPPEGIVIVADQDEWGAPLLADRRTLPFSERDGAYWGPPGSDAEAMDELRRLERRGASHLAIGWPAMWLLDQFPAFGAALRDRASIAHQDGDVVVYALNREE
jgi:hypothetical protein